MKWWLLDEDVQAYINSFIDRVYKMLQDAKDIYIAYKSGQDIHEIPLPEDIEIFEVIAKAKEHADKSKVLSLIKQEIEDSLKRMFPNFSIHGYNFDLDNDVIRRSNNEVLTEQNATNYEIGLLDMYSGIVDYTNDLYNAIVDELESLNDEIRSFRKEVRING